MKKETWVIVANSSQAHIYTVDKNALSKTPTTLDHPESRKLDRDLVSAPPGRAFDSFGSHRHSMEPVTTPKEIECNLFAKDIAQRVNSAHGEGRLERLYLAASPSFLGLLRQCLSTQAQKIVAAEVSKDLTQQSPKDIRTYFPPVL